MTRPLIPHHSLSPLTTDTLDLQSYLDNLIKSSPNLYYSGHSNPITISQYQNESPYLLCLGGDQESRMMIQLYKPHLMLNHSHVILLKAFKLTP